ncbi:unnamed protein product [Angiostrongylus costaricensis]|uniref:Structural maintenance of chromosomes protein 5 n=1 Tax=Angiostrongylus costaricensis TaxID=334426 RepID=A0A0R3PSQ3_ANGCS|nr:unnamed protein product [Angiostrongylus costaricensis]
MEDLHGVMVNALLPGKDNSAFVPHRRHLRSEFLCKTVKIVECKFLHYVSGRCNCSSGSWSAANSVFSLRGEDMNLSEVMEGRLRAFRNCRINVADEAWRWHEGNCEKFRYPVFVPVLHVAVPNGRCALFLENLIAFRDLPMFNLDCKEDEALLTNRRHSWKLNSTVISPSQVDLLVRSVDDVKQYLCNAAMLDLVTNGASKINDLYGTIRTTFYVSVLRRICKVLKLHDKVSSLQSHVASFLSAKITLFECLDNECGLKILNPEQMIPEGKEILGCLKKLCTDESIPKDMPMHRDFDGNEFWKRGKISLVGRREQQKATKEELMTSLMKETTEWWKPIEELIQNITVNYLKFFAQIGCAGEVYLDEPEDPLSLTECGFTIMDSFHLGERLKRLIHQVQSGGKRSVSTMLYLLALHGLCPVPFRCVYEINKDMIPVNGRRCLISLWKRLVARRIWLRPNTFLNSTESLL